jgi:hypothetical protein
MSAVKMQFFVVVRGRNPDFDLQRIDMDGNLQVEVSRTFLD